MRGLAYRRRSSRTAARGQRASLAPSRFTLVALGLTFFLSALPVRAEPATPPNIVFIMLDDVGYADFGSYGNQFIRTPRLDELALAGKRFTQYYAAAPLCSPTRASILTGLYPARSAIRTNIAAGSTRGIPPEFTLLPEVLREQGYATAHIGKWHLGDEPDHLPINRGFDHTVLLAGTPGYLDPALVIDDAETIQHTGHLTSILTDYAIAVSTEHPDVPFFVNLWHLAGHVPLQPPEEWAEQYPETDEGRFAALLSDADEEIGRLVNAIRDFGLAADTIIVVTSDNGGTGNTHDHSPEEGPSNGGLRDAKGEVFEGGIRVPMIAAWEGVVAAGTTDDSRLVSFDFFPTFAELVGADVSTLGLAGESFATLLLDSTPKPRSQTLFWELKEQSSYYQSATGILDTFAVRGGDWKLVHQDEAVSLFDLASDPGEATDLAAANPGVVDDLLAQHGAWRFAEGLIPHAIERVVGDVIIEGDTLTFNGGSVRLAAQSLFDIDDGDFSFAARILPLASGIRQFVAGTGASWLLQLDPFDRLVLTLKADDGETTTLTSATRLVAGVEYEVAFTVYAWPLSDTTVVLYVNGVLEVETNAIRSVQPTDVQVRLGNRSGGATPFLGVVRDLQFYSAALTPVEVEVVLAED